MVTGVELGRWGLPYVGAWRVDNINDTNSISSAPSRTADGVVEEIDASGLYCALIRSDMYQKHQFYYNNGLGPDVNLGLFLRRNGFKNYIDWSIHVTHLTSFMGDDIEIPATSKSHAVTLKRTSHNSWQL